MARFQSVLGIILVITAVVIIAIAIYNIVIIGKATINIDDPEAVLNDGEKKGGIALNTILILIGLVIGIYGVLILLPPEKPEPTVPALKASRSLSGSVLTPGYS